MNQELRLRRKRRSPTYMILFLTFGLIFSVVPIFLASPENPEIWCMNWRPVFQQSLLYARLLFFVILRHLKNIYEQYDSLHILLYLGYIVSVSYVFVVYVLDWCALKMWTWTKDNVIRRLDDSIVIVNENRNETTSMRRIAEKPLSVEEHFRYDYEDVRFHCYDTLTFDSEVMPVNGQVLWKHNGKLVKPSEKLSIDLSFEEINATNSTLGLHSYLVQSTMTIYLLEDRDYGTYTCHLKQMALTKVFKSSEEHAPKHSNNKTQKRNLKRHFDFKFSPCICTCMCMDLENYVRLLEIIAIQFEEMLYHFYISLEIFFNHLHQKRINRTTNYDWTGQFKLTKINKTRKTVSAPPGTIISVSASYLNLAEKQDISLDYQINNKDFLNVCATDVNKCSFFILMYWILWHAEGFFGVIPNLGIYWLQMQNSILGRAWLCVCPSAYGIHVFRFYRNFYNITSGKTEIIEVEHHQTIKLIPRSADLLLVLHNDSKPFVIAEECWDSATKSSWCSKQEKVISEINTNFFWIERLSCFLLFSFGTRVTCFVIWLINQMGKKGKIIILEGLRRIVTTKETLGSIGNMGLPAIIDVYISYADAENNLAHDLANILESFGKKVFFRDRDVAGGRIETEAVGEAIDTSSKYLVIVSDNYINSPFQNSFEFHMILNKILEKRIKGKDVLLLIHGTCNTGNFFHNCTDFEIIVSALICNEKLKQWSSADKEEKSNIMLFAFLFLTSAIFGTAVTVPNVHIIILNYITTVSVLFLTNVIYG